MLIHQLQGAFEAAYEKAAASSKPDDWMNAALFAKQFSNAHREAFQQNAEPMGDERSQQLEVFLRLAEVVQADAKETRDRYPAQSERAEQLAAFMKTACKWATHPAPEAAKPVAWVRFTSDGGVEGPIMDGDRRIDDVRRKSGAWTPLFTRAPEAAQALSVPRETLERWQVLAMTVAECGAVVTHEDGTDTPNRGLWRQVDQELRAILTRASDAKGGNDAN
ncbi:hypothetical protein [Ralstonia holmesii]|uniref:hypothetical protein n=1 Tax=Ralstonia holmesii TaxID=3058602 RepID=UPI003F149906